MPLFDRDGVFRLTAPVAIAGIVFLYSSGLTSFGLVGPDEPRYASIGREMANSGDWVTPRLWGQPWFEKPALLYWMIAAGFDVGFGEDAAPRLPVALCSLAFLVFFFWRVHREWGGFVSAVSTGVLATSTLWVAYSHAAVTDIPLAATFSAAILLLVPAVEGKPIHSKTAAGLLGLSVVAKGLVSLVLALPLLWFSRRRWREWVRPGPLLVFLLVALPWYLLCTMKNGFHFLAVFFVQHQVGRFASPELQHAQPLWFYLPVIVGALFPSSLLLLFACRPSLYQDRRRQCLAAIVAFGFIFFSLSQNKLPGYLLPLLPLLCILVGCGMDEAKRRPSRQLRSVLAASALLLPLFVLAGALLPQALASGLKNALPVDLLTALKIAESIPIAALAGGAMLFLRRTAALTLWFTLAFAGWIYIEYAVLPSVDNTASARSLWWALPEPKRSFCVGDVSRAWRYGLNYYSITPLPSCGAVGAANTGTLHGAILPNANAAGKPLVLTRSGDASH